jgi:hypothetical protein
MLVRDISDMAFDRAIIGDALALDRSANRTIDANGFMHVAVSNISKAAVNGYLGREIPGFAELGLDPDRIYQLLRDPEEMKAAVDTFNGVPLLNRHIPVIPEKLPEDAIVGAMGKEASFEAPYLRNSLTVWSAASIEGIQNRKQAQLSCGYRYKPDMTPGVYQGVSYDGVMRELSANHVSLVQDGRAGSDVVVGDSQLPVTIMEFSVMPKVVLSRKAAVVKGALAVALAPKMLAMDAKLDFNAILAGVTAKNFKTELPNIKARLKTATTGKLAQDASLEDVNQLLDKLDQDDPTVMDDEPPMPVPGNDDDEQKAFIESMKAKMSPEEHAKLCEMLQKKGLVGDADESPEEKAAREKKEKEAAAAGKEKPIDKQAMDAAIAASVTAATNATIARLNAVREAEKIVRPFIGDLAIAQDSDEAVYRMALDHLKVDHKDVHPSALKALVQMHPLPGAKPAPRLAHDAAAASAVATKFPALAAVRSI